MVCTAGELEHMHEDYCTARLVENMLHNQNLIAILDVYQYLTSDRNTFNAILISYLYGGNTSLFHLTVEE